jgi:membrane fusion protein, multidrug efflux system
MNKLWAALICTAISYPGHAATYETVAAKFSNGGEVFVAEGVVEAVKSSLISAQVTGNITTLTVKAGDQIKSGQLLARIDSRIDTQQVKTNQAQVSAAQAELAAARSEYDRKLHLYDKHYISKAALERAESDYKSAEARTNATKAQSGMSQVQAGMHTINAPYTGVVAEVMTEIGSMILPDKPLLLIYDPGQMRVVANVPQSELANFKNLGEVQIEIAGNPKFTSTNVTILPISDAISHTRQIRVALPAGSRDITPGMFARVHFPTTGDGSSQRVHIPFKCIVRRSELTAVYVLDRHHQPQLRQVRLGIQKGDEIEILSGLQAGEQVITDPLAVTGRHSGE